MVKALVKLGFGRFEGQAVSHVFANTSKKGICSFAAKTSRRFNFSSGKKRNVFICRKNFTQVLGFRAQIITSYRGKVCSFQNDTAWLDFRSEFHLLVIIEITEPYKYGWSSELNFLEFELSSLPRVGGINIQVKNHVPVVLLAPSIPQNIKLRGRIC
eukprot:GHVT01041955.1.p1 GENE.GHVT01041955.1~~GHVT01041955.1.p1  ORF type:complete len:157 (-),score=7.31 GHVT01041955.1:755-1225(-)